ARRARLRACMQKILSNHVKNESDRAFARHKFSQAVSATVKSSTNAEAGTPNAPRHARARGVGFILAAEIEPLDTDDGLVLPWSEVAALGWSPGSTKPPSARISPEPFPELLRLTALEVHMHQTRCADPGAPRRPRWKERRHSA